MKIRSAPKSLPLIKPVSPVNNIPKDKPKEPKPKSGNLFDVRV